MIQTKQATVDDIYRFDEYFGTPGVRQGLLELAASGDPAFTIEDTDDGQAVYYRTPHGEVVPVGRPIQLAAAPTETRTDAPTGTGLPTVDKFVENLQKGVTGEAKALNSSMRQKIAASVQEQLEGFGLDRYRARRLSESLFGGESSGAPMGLGLIDFVPVAGTVLQTEESGIKAGEALDLAKSGKTGAAAVKYGEAALTALPGAMATSRVVDVASKAIKKGAQELAPIAGQMAENYLTKTGAILKMAPDSQGIEVSAAPKINTPAFKNWFGSSKVVDEKGKPLVVYHGTDQSFDEFRGNAYFTPVPEDASKYSYVNTPGKEHSPNVVPVYLSLQKPKTIKTYATRADIDDAKAAGFDGVIVQGVGGSKINHYIVFESTQIKSLFNKGTFDPKDPRILHGGGAAAVTGAATQGEEKK